MESLDVLKEICEFKNCIRSSTCSLSPTLFGNFYGSNQGNFSIYEPFNNLNSVL